MKPRESNSDLAIREWVVTSSESIQSSCSLTLLLPAAVKESLNQRAKVEQDQRVGHKRHECSYLRIVDAATFEVNSDRMPVDVEAYQEV